MKKLTLPLVGKNDKVEHPLIIWANGIRNFYGHPVYIVGSQLDDSVEEPSDVDIICIIPNKEFELRYGSLGNRNQESGTGKYTEEYRWKWLDDCIKRSLDGMKYTGLAIDFKVYPYSFYLAYQHKPKYKIDTRGISHINIKMSVMSKEKLNE